MANIEKMFTVAGFTNAQWCLEKRREEKCSAVQCSAVQFSSGGGACKYCADVLYFVICCSRHL